MPSETKALPKLALGLRNIMYGAVKAHMREHQREKPKQFVFHPEIVAEFIETTPDHERCMLSMNDINFIGIPIVADVLAVRPKYITSRNEVEYL